MRVRLEARDELGDDLGSGLRLFGERDALSGPLRHGLDLAGSSDERGSGLISNDRFARSEER